jgi:hypothetical protein
MAGELVTRDELKAMVEVQSKNVEQLTVIANHLSTIVERENKIYDRLYNGLSKEISTAVISSIEKLAESVDECRDRQVSQCAAAGNVIDEKLKNCDMAKDIGHTKWFIGIVGVIVIVSTIIVNAIVKTGTDDSRNKAVQALVEHFDKHQQGAFK